MATIHTRDQLLDWAEEHAPRPCIRRAMDQGGVVNYGWFHQVTNKIGGGWILEVFACTTRKTYFIAVVPGRLGCTHRCYELDQIPWEHWMGQSMNSRLNFGDEPRGCLTAKLSLTRS